jgi:hypothetical protein
MQREDGFRVKLATALVALVRPRTRAMLQILVIPEHCFVSGFVVTLKFKGIMTFPATVSSMSLKITHQHYWGSSPAPLKLAH